MTLFPYKTLFRSLRGGSFSTFRGAVDANRDLGPVQVRLNAMLESADSYVRFEESDNRMIAPSLRWTVGERFSVLYGAEYLKTRVDGFSNGLPMADGVFDLPASATVSAPWARLDNESLSQRLDLQLDLSQGWLETRRRAAIGGYALAAWAGLCSWPRTGRTAGRRWPPGHRTCRRSAAA